MRGVLLSCALVAATGAAGCFQIDLTSEVLRCDPTMPMQPGNCPDGEQCTSQGICALPGGASSDMGLDAGKVTTSACPSGMGFDVTAAGKPTVYACPTVFANKANMTADVQCKNGYSLCTNANNVDLALCSATGKNSNGYFIANVPAHRAAGQLVCSAGMTGQNLAWSGCGKAGATIITGSCQGFATAVTCAFGGQNFQCQAGPLITDISNTDPNSGVLCCHP
jgi:hypothetical protein